MKIGKMTIRAFTLDQGQWFLGFDKPGYPDWQVGLLKVVFEFRWER